jgi:hypothetical protein
MDENFWAMIARPFAILALFVFVLIPARLAFQRFFPEGKVKRYLLREIK